MLFSSFLWMTISILRPLGKIHRMFLISLLVRPESPMGFVSWISLTIFAGTGLWAIEFGKLKPTEDNHAI
jgi:hypothetical protein